MMAKNLTQALLTKDLEIPVILEREFSAACCIRGYHICNWAQWTAEIGSILTSEPKKRPGALVGHVPKFLSKLTFLTVCYYHVTYAFQSESTLYSCLNVKELLARSRREI